tara:strand:- start:7448 stop:7699 length:252 start_codon:yes stop_codon:yes gene_type:complete
MKKIVFITPILLLLVISVFLFQDISTTTTGKITVSELDITPEQEKCMQDCFEELCQDKLDYNACSDENTEQCEENCSITSEPD